MRMKADVAHSVKAKDLMQSYTRNYKKSKPVQLKPQLSPLRNNESANRVAYMAETSIQQDHSSSVDFRPPNSFGMNHTNFNSAERLQNGEYIFEGDSETDHFLP